MGSEVLVGDGQAIVKSAAEKTGEDRKRTVCQTIQAGGVAAGVYKAATAAVRREGKFSNLRHFSWGPGEVAACADGMGIGLRAVEWSSSCRKWLNPEEAIAI